ncbi:MAG: NAD(+) synthase [Flavobacteriaceae bacterium]|jgi:NAD+ synthase
MKIEKVSNYIVQWLKSYAENAGAQGFVVGISGGIDSAVTSTLAAKTGLPTLCIEMPIHQAPDQLTRSSTHIGQLKKAYDNVRSEFVDLSEVFDHFQNAVKADSSNEKNDLSLANTRARLRMSTLYYHAAIHGFLVAGTGNKVEDFGVGFYTKYGDGGVDLSPIADLLKSEVFALGRALGVTDSILNAAPTDGLFHDSRTDEQQLGATYDELEWAMTQSESDPADNLTQRQLEVLKIYRSLNRANAHKMIPIPVCMIPDDLR